MAPGIIRSAVARRLRFESSRPLPFPTSCRHGGGTSFDGVAIAGLHAPSQAGRRSVPSSCLSSVRRSNSNHQMSTHRGFGSKSKNGKGGGGQRKEQDVYKSKLNSQQQSSPSAASSSIIGKRPGHTPFSPPQNKVASTSDASKTSTPLETPIQQQDHQRPSGASASANRPPNAGANNTARSPTPLVLPPTPIETMQQSPPSNNARDNKDYAHTNPSTSPIVANEIRNGIHGADGAASSNPMRDLFLQRGILPPAPRPTIDAEAKKPSLAEGRGTPHTPPVPVEIPEADPSGVSHANPEDVLDMSSMYDPSIHLPDKPNFASPSNRRKYEAGTPLTDELIAYIGVRGPITVAEFMRRALRDGRFGYYTGKGKRVGVAATQDGNESFSEDRSTHAASLIDEDDDNDWDLEDDDDRPATTNEVGSDGASVGGTSIIGLGGDFITAPEISQLFGESILVWFMTQYQTLGSPDKVQIIEIGPGKGTLICDIVRSAVETFPDFAKALTTSVGSADAANAVVGGDGSVEDGTNVDGFQTKKKVTIGLHLVEVTDGMRARQRESLLNLQNEKVMKEKRFSFQFEDGGDGPQSVASDTEGDQSSHSDNKVNVSWHDVLSSVPTHDAETGEAIPCFILCQELVDALPIHSFEKIEGNVWRERLVDVAVRDEVETKEAQKDIRLAAAAAAAAKVTAAARSTYTSAEKPEELSKSTDGNDDNAEGTRKKIPRLRFVLPPDTTPALRTLLRVDNRGSPLPDNPSAAALNALPTGSIIEACPEGLLLVQDIANRIEKCPGGGAALLIDYGGDGSSGGDSLRGFYRHGQVHPLSLPGEVDVTADVDFGALREAVNSRIGLEESLVRKLKKEGRIVNNDAVDTSKASNHRPEAFGPITQGKFLAQMGMVQRVTTKIEDPNTTDEQAEEIYSAMERLMAPEEMGERYKVLAVARKKEDLFPPPGF